MPPLDVGQPVVWEAWIDRNDSLARVRYRGAGWDARVSADTAGEAGEVLYIVDVEGSLLHVAKRQPA
jgi:membrane protein implicated in regulation of membrane protease activity